MKKLALITSAILATGSSLSAGELENLRSANAEHKRQISALEKEIDNLYSLLAKEMRNNGKKPITPQSKVTKPTSSSHYIVKKGDTLSKIARRNNISLGTLMNANKLRSNSILQIGQKLIIPIKSTKISTSLAAQKPIIEAQKLAPLPSIPKAVVVKSLTNYKVQKGDTFYSIARKHNVSVSSLTTANPNLNPSSLHIGQSVILPSHSAKGIASTTTKPTVKKKPAPVVKKQTPKPVVKKQVTQTPKKSVTTVSTQSKPEEMKAISLSSPMTLQQLADKYSTSVDAINALNSWSYRPTIKLAKGSEIYLPN